MGPRIEGGRAVEQFADGTEQEVVLQRTVRREGGVRPRGPAIVVALAAEVDVGVRVVFVREHVRGGEEEIRGRGNRVAELRRIGIGLVRIVTDDAGDGDVVVVSKCDGGVQSVDQREPGGAGMTTAATADVVGGCAHGCEHVRRHGGMFAGVPFFKRRRVGVGGVACAMAAAAGGGGDFNARDRGGIIGGGRMIGRRTVAIFALNAAEQRRRRRTDKPGWQAITNGMTRQA